MNHYTIKDGNVVEVSPLSRGLSTPEVPARNKTEATQILLRQAQQVLSGFPLLHVRNGAFLLVYPNGEGWNTETGRLDRRDSSGAVTPLSSGCVDTLKDALANRDFAYYASDEYVSQSKG